MQEAASVTTEHNRTETHPIRHDCSAISCGAMPVSLAKVGQTGTVVKISGNTEVRKFLSDIGFTVGVGVTVVSDLNGSKILSIRGSKIAVDGRMASKIMFCPE